LQLSLQTGSDALSWSFTAPKIYSRQTKGITQTRINGGKTQNQWQRDKNNGIKANEKLFGAVTLHYNASWSAFSENWLQLFYIAATPKMSIFWHGSVWGVN